MNGVQFAFKKKKHAIEYKQKHIDIAERNVNIVLGTLKYSLKFLNTTNNKSVVSIAPKPSIKNMVLGLLVR